jgi:hypothetical protein
LKLITGRGRHSADNVAKLRPALLEYLIAQGLHVEEQVGCLTVMIPPRIQTAA